MIRAASPTLKSGDEAALAALRVPPAQRSVEEHAAVRRWSERSVRLPGRTTHEELCTVMTLEEHPPHSLLFRQGTPGETFYVVFSGEVGLYFEPGAPEDAASAMIAAMIRGKITRRVVALELAARKVLAAEGGGASGAEATATTGAAGPAGPPAAAATAAATAAGVGEGAAAAAATEAAGLTAKRLVRQFAARPSTDGAESATRPLDTPPPIAAEGEAGESTRR